jgi:hypothetical protein
MSETKLGSSQLGRPHLELLHVHGRLCIRNMLRQVCVELVCVNVGADVSILSTNLLWLGCRHVQGCTRVEESNGLRVCDSTSTTAAGHDCGAWARLPALVARRTHHLISGQRSAPRNLPEPSVGRPRPLGGTMRWQRSSPDVSAGDDQNFGWRVRFKTARRRVTSAHRTCPRTPTSPSSYLRLRLPLVVVDSPAATTPTPSSTSSHCI